MERMHLTAGRVARCLRKSPSPNRACRGRIRRAPTAVLGTAVATAKFCAAAWAECARAVSVFSLYFRCLFVRYGGAWRGLSNPFVPARSWSTCHVRGWLAGCECSVAAARMIRCCPAAERASSAESTGQRLPLSPRSPRQQQLAGPPRSSRSGGQQLFFSRLQAARCRHCAGAAGPTGRERPGWWRLPPVGAAVALSLQLPSSRAAAQPAAPLLCNTR